MDVITLVGNTHSRKTQVITEIKDDLINNGAKLHLFFEEGADKKDFKALLTFKENRIAFCSIGYIADKGHLDSEYILRGLIFASKNNADVLINAYTTPFPEFPEDVYESIIGQSNLYVPVQIDKTSNLGAIKNFIISRL